MHSARFINRGALLTPSRDDIESVVRMRGSAHGAFLPWRMHRAHFCSIYLNKTLMEVKPFGDAHSYKSQKYGTQLRETQLEKKRARKT